MSAEKHKYQQLADQTQNLVQATGRPGERLLSIRDFASREHVSISTAQRVYELLELRGLIESRPRSGYYLAGKARSQRPKLPVDLPVASLEIPLPETRQEWLDSQSSEAWHGRAFSAYFAIGTPDVSLAGVRVLNRILRQLTRKDSSAIHGYGPLLGDMHLRRQLVQRLALAGAVSHSEALLVTSGGQEALYLAVNACTEPGDLIAVESPAYHGITGVVQGTGRRLIEIPTDPVTGIDLDSLHMALENLPIRALVLSTSAQNPLGFSMDDDRRRALMALANTYDIAVIEDDVYGELLYARSRDRCMRAYDTEDRVLTCGSVSKTLGPGFRVGWLETERWMNRAADIKRISSMRTSMPCQLAVARHMAEGHYDRHLRLARTLYAQRGKSMQQAIRRHFPAECRVSRPQGGYMLWVELPAHCSGLELAGFALSRDIALSPGCLFSHRGHYAHCIRLCFSQYADRHEGSLAVLGDWLKAQDSK